jgi:hypothetical protein
MRESLSPFLFCCRRDFFSPTKGKEEKVRERERERERDSLKGVKWKVVRSTTIRGSKVNEKGAMAVYG